MDVTLNDKGTQMIVKHPSDPDASVQWINGDNTLHLARAALSFIRSVRVSWKYFTGQFHSSLSLAEVKGTCNRPDFALALPEWSGVWEQNGMTTKLTPPREGFVGVYSLAGYHVTMRQILSKPCHLGASTIVFIAPMINKSLP